MTWDDIFDTIWFKDANGFEWDLHILPKGLVITHNVPSYFVPSFFEKKLIIIEPNGDLDLITEFIPKPGVVPESEDLFDFLESLLFNRENEFEEVYLSPSKLIVT